MRSPTELTRLFRDRGLKVTPQRQCIFRLLHANSAHPTAESVYLAARAEMPTISLRTVYGTLHDLAAMGEVRELDLGTGAARFDPNVEHTHHHLVCGDCGRVRDLHADYPGLSVPGPQLQGFRVGVAEVIFRGKCAECRTPDPIIEKKTGKH
ncbi:MAG: Fur family transcriptional regulator [Acidimicrobiales bacterium]